MLSHGFSAAVTIICAILVSMTFTPCLIAQFPSTFDDGDVEAGQVAVDNSSRFEEIWKLWGRYLTTSPWFYVIPIFAILVMLPIGYRALHAEMNHDMMMGFAQNTPENMVFR